MPLDLHRLLNVLTGSFDVRDHNGNVPLFGVVCVDDILIGIVVVVPGIVVKLTVVEEFLVQLVECPIWKLTCL